MEFYSVENLSKLKLIEEYWSFIETRHSQSGAILKEGKASLNEELDIPMFSYEFKIEEQKSNRSKLKRLYPDTRTLMKIVEQSEKLRTSKKRPSKILTRFCEIH